LISGCLGTKGKGDIVIGVAWPFESNNSLFKEGVELAVKEINQAGGVEGRKVKLVLKDDRGSVAEGMAVAQSFVQERQVAAVIGHRNSFISIPAARIYEYEEYGKILFPGFEIKSFAQMDYGCNFQGKACLAMVWQAILLIEHLVSFS